MIKNKSINGWYWAGAICLPIFIYITLVTYFTPLMYEDLYFPINGDGSVFLGIKEAWLFYKKAYFSIDGGRFYYFFIGLFLHSFYRTTFDYDFSQTIFAILNGLVFVILLINLFFLAFARKPIFNDKNDRIKLCIIFFLMMTILAEKGETIFWLTGRLSYLWGATLISLLAVFFRLAFAHDGFLKFHRQPIKHFLFIVLMMPLAIVAGMTDYVAVLIALGLLTFGLFYTRFIAKKKLPLWCYIIFGFFVIGVILLFIAPGNYIQYNSGWNLEYLALSTFEKIVLHPLDTWDVFLDEMFYLPLLILLAFSYWQKHIIVKGKNFGKDFLNRFISKMKQDKNFGMAVIFLLATFGFVTVLGAFPRHNPRTYFFGTCVFLLACLLVIDFLFFSINKTKLLKLLQKHIIVKNSIIFISLSLFAIYLLHALTFVVIFNRQFEDRMQSVKEQKEAGKDIITVKPYMTPSYYKYLGRHRYSFWDSEDFKRSARYMRDYYGVKKVLLEEEK